MPRAAAAWPAASAAARPWARARRPRAPPAPPAAPLPAAPLPLGARLHSPPSQTWTASSRPARVEVAQTGWGEGDEACGREPEGPTARIRRRGCAPCAHHLLHAALPLHLHHALLHNNEVLLCGLPACARASGQAASAGQAAASWLCSGRAPARAGRQAADRQVGRQPGSSAAVKPAPAHRTVKQAQHKALAARVEVLVAGQQRALEGLGGARAALEADLQRDV